MTDDQQKNPDIEPIISTAPSGNGTPETVLPETTDKEPAPPPPEERIATLESEKAELRERMLRVAADFDNWKKRSRKELSDVKERTKEEVLRDMLDVIDNLERAAASFNAGNGGKEADAKSIRDGVELVLRQFRTKLERYQVKAIDAAGHPFDPRFHEAISQLPTSEALPGSVVHELQKGYAIGDKLLRPAMVVVAAAPPAAPELPPEQETAAKKTDGED